MWKKHCCIEKSIYFTYASSNVLRANRLSRIVYGTHTSVQTFKKHSSISLLKLTFTSAGIVFLRYQASSKAVKCKDLLKKLGTGAEKMDKVGRLYTPTVQCVVEGRYLECRWCIKQHYTTLYFHVTDYFKISRRTLKKKKKNIFSTVTASDTFEFLIKCAELQIQQCL